MYLYFVFSVSNISVSTVFLNGSQLAKMKKYIPYMSLHEIYRVEAVGLKSSNYTLKSYDFCEYVKFGAIAWKNWYFVNNCLIKVWI